MENDGAREEKGPTKLQYCTTFEEALSTIRSSKMNELTQQIKRTNGRQAGETRPQLKLPRSHQVTGAKFVALCWGWGTLFPTAG
jgi:hypothetical protein